MRFMAQGLHRIASQIDLKKDYASSSKRFELALFAREAAADILQRRRSMGGRSRSAWTAARRRRWR